jgi:hypothetical protein
MQFNFSLCLWICIRYLSKEFEPAVIWSALYMIDPFYWENGSDHAKKL